MYLNKASYRIVLNLLVKDREIERAVYLFSLMLERVSVHHFGTSNELLMSFCEAEKIVEALMVFCNWGILGLRRNVVLGFSWLNQYEEKGS